MRMEVSRLLRIQMQIYSPGRMTDAHSSANAKLLIWLLKATQIKRRRDVALDECPPHVPLVTGGVHLNRRISVLRHKLHRRRSVACEVSPFRERTSGEIIYELGRRQVWEQDAQNYCEFAALHTHHVHHTSRSASTTFMRT